MKCTVLTSLAGAGKIENLGNHSIRVSGGGGGKQCVFVMVISRANSIYLKIHCPLDYPKVSLCRCMSSCQSIVCYNHYLAKEYHKENF